MKLEIPFYQQTTELNCGPSALRMVIAYFDKDIGLEILEQRTEIKEGKSISTIQIATAAALSGYQTKFFSKHVNFNKENLKLKFYQKYSDAIQQSNQVVIDAQKAGVIIEEREITLQELLQYVTNKSIPIVLLDWNVINGTKEKGYLGHFVPVVGYDKKNVYVHNHGLDNPAAFLQIKRDIFDEARKARGTDEDIVIIYNK